MKLYSRFGLDLHHLPPPPNEFKGYIAFNPEELRDEGMPSKWPAFRYIGSYIGKHPLRVVEILFEDKIFEITPEHGAYRHDGNTSPRNLNITEIKKVKKYLNGLEGMVWERRSPLLINGPDEVKIKEEIARMLNRYSQNLAQQS